MKNIELTEDHKSKLLEMCKELFPEYPDLQFGVKEKHNWSKEYLVFGLTGNVPIIHWFEFCMTHLCDKVFIHDESLNEFLLTFNVDKHPVDYLYEEFKKLKQ